MGSSVDGNPLQVATGPTPEICANSVRQRVSRSVAAVTTRGARKMTNGIMITGKFANKEIIKHWNKQRYLLYHYHILPRPRVRLHRGFWSLRWMHSRPP